MTYSQFPIDELHGISTILQNVCERFDDKHAADDCDGLERDGQEDIGSAIDEFRAEWKASALRTVADIGEWGVRTANIAQFAYLTDQANAARLQREQAFTEQWPFPLKREFPPVPFNPGGIRGSNPPGSPLNPPKP